MVIWMFTSSRPVQASPARKTTHNVNGTPNSAAFVFIGPKGHIMVWRMSSVRPSVCLSVRPLAISCATNSSFIFQHNFFKLSGMIDTDV